MQKSFFSDDIQYRQFLYKLNPSRRPPAKMLQAKATAGGIDPLLTFLGFGSKKLERPKN